MVLSTASHVKALRTAAAVVCLMIWNIIKSACPTIAILLTFFNCGFVLDVVVFIHLMITPACLTLCSPSSRMLSCWFLKSLPLPTAEYASCCLSPGALKSSTASGGRCWKEGTFMLKSPLELCPRAVKTGQQAVNSNWHHIFNARMKTDRCFLNGYSRWIVI